MQRLAERSPLAEQPIYYLPECGSTMDEARALCLSPEEHGTVVMTDFQRAGRGRREGRVWYAPAGSSLMFTLALHRPEKPVLQSLRMALSVALLLEQEWAASPRVKWPNDVLVDGRKICGILADAAGDWVYIGVGLNITQRSFPEEISHAATSFADQGFGFDNTLSNRVKLLEKLLAVFANPVEVEGRLLPELDMRLWRRGEDIEIESLDGGVRAGRLLGIDPHGLLMVDCGEVERFAAGEIRLRTGERV